MSEIVGDCAVQCEAIVEGVKAVKNEVEQTGMRNANVKNCVSLVQYFAYLEDHLMKEPETTLTEYYAAHKLDHFRYLQPLNMGSSFGTISSIGPNGAIIHYKPKKDTALPMRLNNVYLLDSGVQYLDGTTDITRTVYLGD